MIRDSIAQAIRMAHVRSGLRATDLAKKAEVYCCQISTWEAGRHLPDLLSLRKLVIALGVSADELLCVPPKENGEAEMPLEGAS